MNKNEILNSLQNACLEHKKWVGYAHKLLDGHDLDYVQAPARCTECNFGIWFYSEQGRMIKRVPGANKIEHQHYLFHECYEVLYFAAPQVYSSKGFLASKKHQQEQYKELLLDFNKLKTQSRILLDILKGVEKIAQAMPEKLFQDRDAER